MRKKLYLDLYQQLHELAATNFQSGLFCAVLCTGTNHLKKVSPCDENSNVHEGGD